MPSTPYASRYWRSLRLRVLRQAGHRCYWCGGKATEADHLKSVAEGGQLYDPANLVASCKRCNSSRGAELLKAKDGGGFLGARRRVHPHLSMQTDSSSRVQFGAIRV